MERSEQGVGRPRSSEVDRAIAEATVEVLAEQGYAGLTVDAVAARAGVGKAVIYRRHASKQEMIFAAVVRGPRAQPPPDAGSLAADLAAVCRTVADQLTSAPSDVLHGVLADVYADPLLAARFTEGVLVPERAMVTQVLERAVAREELRALPDPAVVHALLIGPVFAWLLVLSEDPDGIPELVDAVSQAVSRLLLV